MGRPKVTLTPIPYVPVPGHGAGALGPSPGPRAWDMGVRVTFGLLRVAAPEPDHNAYLQYGPPITEEDFYETDRWGQKTCILCGGKVADEHHVNSAKHLDRMTHPQDYLVWDRRLRRYTRGW